jgi:hypothetical protein
MEIGRERHDDFSPEQGIFQQPATVTFGESSARAVWLHQLIPAAHSKMPMRPRSIRLMRLQDFEFRRIVTRASH